MNIQRNQTSKVDFINNVIVKGVGWEGVKQILTVTNKGGVGVTEM